MKKDLLAAAGVLKFLAGAYLLFRWAWDPSSDLVFLSGFCLAVLGCLTFCVADPFFEM